MNIPECYYPPVVGATPKVRALEIISEVAAKHGLTCAHIIGPQRLRTYVRARRAAIHAVLVAYPHMSSPQLGRLFNRDHSTILHALRRTGRSKLLKRSKVSLLDGVEAPE